MKIALTRRALGGAAVAAALLGSVAASSRPLKSGRFGQVNRVRARPGRVDDLQRELHAIVLALPMADRYELLRDDRDTATFWTVEIWPSKAAHDRAVGAPAIQQAIDRCRLIVAEFENVATFFLPATAPSL